MSVAPENYTNNAQSYLQAGISAGAVSLTVLDATRFPSKTPFRIIVDQEIFLVTNRAGNVFTVIPGYEETQAVDHSLNALVTHVLTRGSLYASVESNQTANLRLTYSTDVNAVAASGDTLYAMPFRGNKIDLYEPTQSIWQRSDIGSGISISVPTNTGSGGGFCSGGSPSNIYDAFIYYDSTTGVSLELSNWQNATARKPEGEIVRQDGVWVKSLEKGKRYVGTIMTIPNALGGPGMDSGRRRYIYNAQNQVPRPIKSTFPSFTQNPPQGLSTVGNSTDNRFEYVCGLPEGFVDAELNVALSFEQSNFGDSTYELGFGDTTISVIRDDTVTNPIAPYYSVFPVRCTFKDVPTPGYRFIQPLQVVNNGTFIVSAGGSGNVVTLIDGSYLS